MDMGNRFGYRCTYHRDHFYVDSRGPFAEKGKNTKKACTPSRLSRVTPSTSSNRPRNVKSNDLNVNFGQFAFQPTEITGHHRYLMHVARRQAVAITQRQATVLFWEACALKRTR